MWKLLKGARIYIFSLFITWFVTICSPGLPFVSLFQSVGHKTVMFKLSANCQNFYTAISSRLLSAITVHFWSHCEHNKHTHKCSRQTRNEYCFISFWFFFFFVFVTGIDSETVLWCTQFSSCNETFLPLLKFTATFGPVIDKALSVCYRNNLVYISQSWIGINFQ